MGSISVALGLYSVYKELQRDLESTLRRVKVIGYEGVEFYGPFDQGITSRCCIHGIN
ncbi:hypothetical protein [Paenibacillus gorillae]|uniref:hypothetical protein n=1 Tax=Paenibacillus gorillae TaxID=1243662 RepID=UPI0004BBA4A5|nr:hypothetical protein [Paenibacillus gorillae]